MLYNRIDMYDRYDLSAPAFQKAFEFLKRPELKTLPEGQYPVCEGVTAHVQLYTTSPREQLDFETHDNFFDLQYVVEGVEGIAVQARTTLQEKCPYDPQRDIQFWQEPDRSGMVILGPGDFSLLPPDMAHKPRCSVNGACAVRKIVVKIPAVPKADC